MLNLFLVFVILNIFTCITCLNPYISLNITNNSTQQEIKRAFKHLSITYHPDKNNNQISDRYIQILNSYEILKDPSRRQLYDLTGRTEGYTSKYSNNKSPKQYQFYNDIFQSEEEQEYSQINRQSFEDVEIRYYTTEAGKIKTVRIHKKKQLQQNSFINDFIIKMMIPLFILIALGIAWRYYNKQIETEED